MGKKSPRLNDPPWVLIGLGLFLVLFWGAFCFGPPFMRDLMGQIFSAIGNVLTSI